MASSSLNGPRGTLVSIDMLGSRDLPDAEGLLAEAACIAPRISTLAGHCRAAGVPVIYANHNHGHRRSDQRRFVTAAMSGREQEADVARRLEPLEADYVVRKPKHHGGQGRLPTPTR